MTKTRAAIGAIMTSAAITAGVILTPHGKPSRRVIEEFDENGKYINAFVVGPDWEEKYEAKYKATKPKCVWKERDETPQVKPITTLNK